MTEPGGLMRREIAAQPAMLRRLLELPVDADVVEAIRRRRPAHLQLVARGTSGHSALHTKYLAEALLGLPVVIVAPSVVTSLGGSPWGRGDVVIAISQSGASPDLVACVASARAAGALTLAFVNAAGSPLGHAAEHELALGAGEEVAVAATKSYTASLLALTRLVAALAPVPPEWPWAEIPDAVERMLSDISMAHAGRVALEGASSAIVLGRSYEYATAREAALKIMETCAIPTLAYSSAEFQHGPLAAVGPSTAVLATAGVDADVLDACRRAGAHVVSAPGSTLPPELAPLADIVPFQMLALEASIARGLDPDSPPVLAKATLTL